MTYRAPPCPICGKHDAIPTTMQGRYLCNGMGTATLMACEWPAPVREPKPCDAFKLDRDAWNRRVNAQMKGAK